MPVETEEESSARAFSCFMGDRRKTVSDTLEREVASHAQRTHKCGLCNKVWSGDAKDGHGKSVMHQKMLQECQSLNDLCGFRADRALHTVSAKPYFGTPDQESFAQHWGGQGTDPRFFKERFLAEARKVLCESGFRFRQRKSHPEEHFRPDPDEVELDLYAVPYTGQGMYDEKDVGLLYDALPRRPGAAGAAPVFPPRTGGGQWSVYSGT